MDEQVKGLVFNVQRFSLHDGPGIRTVVFLKGCPLRCRWCSNPESISRKIDIFYNESTCIRCGICEQVCPKGAISLDSGKGYIIDRTSCLGCGECAKQCPAGAKQLIGEYKTVPEVIQLIMRDRPFYMNSGGGVTLSGGEILQQPAFAYEILKESRVLGIQTAIETSGYGQWEWLDRISDVCSTIHYDIKALDVNQHRDLTSRSNKLILENLQALDFKLAQLQVEKRPKLILRIPLIENLNDSEEEVVRLGMYIKHNLTSYDRIELLPFHNFGESKYQKLDLNYEFIGVSNAAKLKYEPLAARLLELDLSAAVMTW